MNKASMAFRIVRLNPSHIKAVVRVHMTAFPGFFLTFLGPGFLREFYRSFLEDLVGVAFVAEDVRGGRVLGAVVGPLVPAGHFKRLLKRRWWAFCLASVRALLKRPSVVKRLFRALFYRGEGPPEPRRSLLSSIIVAPEAHGQGIGKALVEAWVTQVQRSGSLGCYLTTDALNNDKVNRFYQRLGWKLESTYQTPEGRAMNRYVLRFPGPDQESENAREASRPV